MRLIITLIFTGFCCGIAGCTGSTSALDALPLDWAGTSLIHEGGLANVEAWNHPPDDFMTRANITCPQLHPGQSVPEVKSACGRDLALQCRMQVADGQIDVYEVVLTSRHLRYIALFQDGLLTGAYCPPPERWELVRNHRGTEMERVPTRPATLLTEMRASENLLLTGRLDRSLRANAWCAEVSTAYARRATDMSAAPLTVIMAPFVPMILAGQMSADSKDKTAQARYAVAKVPLGEPVDRLVALFGPPLLTEHEDADWSAAGDWLVYGYRPTPESVFYQRLMVHCRDGKVIGAYADEWIAAWSGPR